MRISTLLRKSPHLRWQSIIFLSLFALAGCSGSDGDSVGSGETPDRSASAQSSSNTADKSDWFAYEREEEYAGHVKLPLEFFPTARGKNIGISVFLPANEDGKAAEGPFPAILVQTAYNMSLSGPAPTDLAVLAGGPDPYFLKRGYAIVAVDALGSGVSEGGWKMLDTEEQEAYGDAVDWVQSQSWSNGVIGGAGASYMGISAIYAAQQRPMGLQAIFAVVPLGEAQRGTVGIGGLINGVFMKTWMTITQKLGTQNLLAMLQNPQHAGQIMRSTEEHISYIDSFYIPLIEDALDGADYLRYDSDFWRQRSPIEKMDRITAPTFITGALHDIFQRDAPLLYEKVKDNVDARLAMFDGDHIGNIAQASNGSEALSPLAPLMLQWFDKHLRGMDSGTENIPPITQFVKNYEPRGSDRFITTTAWPHPDADVERWYLHGNKTLSKEAPVTEEQTNSMAAADHADITYGKSDGGQFLIFEVVPTDGTDCSLSYKQWTLGSSGSFFPPACMTNNYDVEKDALNYESRPMREDYFINGPIQADIWMETNVTEAVLSVRIDEVSPDGKTVLPITNGLLLASARAVDESRSRYLNGEMIQPYHYLSKEEVADVIPGEPFKMQVEIFQTSAIIRKGHRLRVSLAPSNHAQGVLNYEQRARTAGGTTTILNSAEYPSSIVLPIVPLSSLN